MSNGKFALKSIQKEEEIVIPVKIESVTRFDLIGEAAYRFFLVPLALFVGFTAFFSGGLESACKKTLEIMEGPKKGRKGIAG